MTKYFKIVIEDGFDVNEKIISDAIKKCIKLSHEECIGSIKVIDITDILEKIR